MYFSRKRRVTKVSRRCEFFARGAFTLVELLTVIVIIGILLAFIVNAAIGSMRSAQETATQGLITKLEGGLNDRLDALLDNRPDANWAHYYMATIYAASGPIPPLPTATLLSGPPPSFPRAQVFALYDYLKAEMPDVFFVQSNNANYPLNFAGLPFPGTTISGSGPDAPYILPLGNSMVNNPQNNLFGDGNIASPAGTGVYGATYFAAAGMYKNLGYQPEGYDGADNNFNGLIDDFAEGVNIPPAFTQPNAALVQQVQANLKAHTHTTARAEVLYAVLVEGQGPLGSVFNRDDFTDKEVKDTDGDGLPEFVDAWGQPLQFFRWPLLYHSNTQRGQSIDSTTGIPTLVPPYASVFDPREQDPLDANQQLLAPGWWYGGAGGNSSYPTGLQLPGTATSIGASFGAQAFEYFFHRLTEPLTHSGVNSIYWDRGTTYPYRRAFFSKFLVVSGGLDQQPGVFIYPYTVMDINSTVTPDQESRALIANENNALPFSAGTRAGFDLVDFTSAETITGTPPVAIPVTYSNLPTNPSSYELFEAAKDDISNQSLSPNGQGVAP